MICKKCGEEIADDSKFCPVCGAKIEAEAAVEAPVETPAEAPVETPAEAAADAPAEVAKETPAETQAAPAVEPVPTTVDPTVAMKASGKKVLDVLRKVPAKVWGIAVAAILAIIVICNIVSCAGKKSPFITVDAKEGFVIDTADSLITYTGKKIAIDEGIYRSEFNYNNTFATVLDLDNVLWAVNTKKAVKIAEDVSDFTISLYGDTVVYKVKDGNDFTVYAYDVAKKKSKKIYDDNYSSVVISSNGKYIALCNTDGDLMVSKKGASAKKEYSDARPVAITNDGKNIFLLKNDKFCLNDEKICNRDSLSKISFNITRDEVLYSVNGSTYYFTVKFKEPVKVKGDSLSGVILPENTASVGGNYETTYGVKSFNGITLNLEGAVYYMSKKGDSIEKLCGGYNDYVMSSDGRSLVYTSGGSIYKIADVRKTAEPKKLGNELDARILFASDDLKTVYYVNTDRELRFLKKDGKGELIADDISVYGVSSAVALYDKKLKCMVYANTDNEILTAKTTKKSRQKLSMGEVNPIGIFSNGTNTYVYVVDEDNNSMIYHVTSIKKVKKIATIDATSIMGK